MKLSKDYIGKSLSHATLRHHDLLISFIKFIEVELNSRSEYNYLFKELFDEYGQEYPFIFSSSNKDGIIIDTEKLWEYYGTVIYSDKNNEHEFDKVYEDFSDMLDRILTFLNNMAPDNCYFGTSEGDGSDFGFWNIVDGDFGLTDEEVFREVDDDIISNECEEPSKEITDEFEEKLSDEYLLELVITEMFSHGDFFKALCLAYKIADGTNRKLLNPSMVSIMKNYGIIK